jgi:hypothetical protein
MISEINMADPKGIQLPARGCGMVPTLPCSPSPWYDTVLSVAEWSMLFTNDFSKRTPAFWHLHM